MHACVYVCMGHDVGLYACMYVGVYVCMNTINNMNVPKTTVPEETARDVFLSQDGYVTLDRLTNGK